MSITPAQLQWRTAEGVPIRSGVVGNVFGTGVVGGATEYARIELKNTHPSLTWSAGRVWCVLDPDGVAFAVAVESASALSENAFRPDVDPATLTYSAPTSFTAGLVLPDLAPGARARLVIRRVLTGAAVTAETNRLRARGSSPL